MSEKETVVLCGYCNEETTFVGSVEDAELYKCKQCGTLWDLDRAHEECIDVTQLLHNFKKKKVAG